MVRHKNRYIVLEIIEGKSVDQPLILRPDALHNAINKQVQQLHGDFGSAAIRPGFIAKYCNQYTRVAVVRVRRGPHKLVTCCIPLIKVVDSRPVQINILYVGATIKHCFKFLKLYQERKFDEVAVNMTSGCKEAFREAIMNMDSVLAIL